VLSLALRRRRPELLIAEQQRRVEAFIDLSDRGEVVLLGMIRQELLSGVRHREQFERIQHVLDGYGYLDVNVHDHDVAAEFTNRCRSAGVAAGDVDMLICAVATREAIEVFTTDDDFERYARVLGVRVRRD
jgi:predicted nucleic acid-binding protein